MSKRNRKFVAICGALLASVLLTALSVSSASAAIGPKWRLEAFSNTTVAPGDTLSYRAQATNIGDEAIGGNPADPIAFEVRLPAGMIVVGNPRTFNNAAFSIAPCVNAGPGPSTPDGAGRIVCESSEAVPAEGVARELRIIDLNVAVAPSATGTLVPEFEIRGGGAPIAKTVGPVTVSATPPGFGIDAFDGQVSDAKGDPMTQAGAHPYDATVNLDFNTLKSPVPIEGELWTAGPLKDVFVELPPGFVGDPTALGTCTLGQLAKSKIFSPISECPASSQVGTVLVRTRVGDLGQASIGPLPVFSLETPPDVPARFGFNILGTVITLNGEVRAGDYGISVNARSVPQGLAVVGNTFTFWGVPASPAHDRERACPGTAPPYRNGPTCAAGIPAAAFLRNPTSCTAPGVGLPTTVKIDAWDNPGAFVSKTFVTHEPPGYPLPEDQWGPQVGTTGCEKVPFNPSFEVSPSNKEASEPSGFSFNLSLPQTDDPSQIATSDLKKAVVTLPQGLRVSSSSASGLGACSQSQIALGSNSDPTCPDSSKIGSVNIKTPLLKDPLEGSVYLATPNDNKFNSLLALYITAEGPGVVVKLPGEVKADPSTGQLTATFDDNPQLPFEELALQFKSGPRAPLSMPNACGTYSVHSELTSWSGKTVSLNSPFSVDQNCAPRGFSPKLDAGLQNPLAATKSPFLLRLTRGDSDQELSSLNVSVPQGLTAVLKGVPYCPQAQIDAAKAKSGLGQGASELSSPSCPQASRVGTALVGAGAGPNPYYVSGNAYLAGPYKGAPLSLAIITPAIAGPFDLGAVVVQSAIFVDPSTAQITVKSDPVPTILHGIPLQVRDIRVAMDRPQFTLAPTSCDPMAVAADVQSAQGQSASPSQRFQVTNCSSLAFKPKLALRLKGGTRRGSYPAFSATLTAKPGEANIAKAQVTLPHSEFLAQEHIKTICTRVQFAADNCPSGSIYGYAKAITPLLDQPLQGPVYLRSSSNPLPDLVADLDGQIHVVLAGRIDSHDQGIRNTFAVVPDAPVSKFTLTMRGGKKGLLVNSRNLCKSVNKASVKMDGQNGKAFESEPVLGDSCGKKAKKRGKGSGRK